MNPFSHWLAQRDLNRRLAKRKAAERGHSHQWKRRREQCDRVFGGAQ